MRFFQEQGGQSLVEILVALGVFAVGIVIVSYLVIDSSIAFRQSVERTQAVFLAQEGLAAAESLGQADFDNLAAGTYGLALSAGAWSLVPAPDLTDQFERQITIADIDIDTKEITSTVSWDITAGRPGEVALTERLTDWEQTHGAAGFLDVNIENAVLAAADQEIQGLQIQNIGAADITIDKITVSWDINGLIESIDIGGGTVWSESGPGAPSGKQASGTELDIQNYLLGAGAGWTDVDRLNFDRSMVGGIFIIKFAMTDGSMRYVTLHDLPSATPSWENPKLAGVCNLPGNSNALAVYAVGDVVYLGTRNLGADFYTCDVSDPANPVLLGSLELGGDVNDIAVSGHYAYLATARNDRELQIIDVSNPAALSLVGYYDKPGNQDAYGVALSGNTAYLTTASVGGKPGYEFYSIDISDPVNPFLRGGLSIDERVNKIAVSGHYAYLATAGAADEFRVIDISDPANPTEAAVLDLPGGQSALSVFVQGNYAYAGKANDADGGRELFIIDVTDPRIPVLTGEFEAGGDVNGIFVKGTILFLASNAVGLEFQAADVSSPAVPNLLGAYDIGESANDVFAGGDYVYLATNINSQELIILEPN